MPGGDRKQSYRYPCFGQPGSHVWNKARDFYPTNFLQLPNPWPGITATIRNLPTPKYRRMSGSTCRAKKWHRPPHSGKAIPCENHRRIWRHERRIRRRNTMCSLYWVAHASRRQEQSAAPTAAPARSIPKRMPPSRKPSLVSLQRSPLPPVYGRKRELRMRPLLRPFVGIHINLVHHAIDRQDVLRHSQAVNEDAVIFPQRKSLANRSLQFR
jgi:hypothetical protein